jgi:hypothetical protein
MLYLSLQSKTFNVTTSKGKTAGLTLDWHMGFALYDTESKTYSWKYKFSQLKGSSDDGKCKLKLHFQNAETKIIETKVSIPYGRCIIHTYIHIYIHTYIHIISYHIISVGP